MAAPARAHRTHGPGHPEIAGHASARITQEGIVMNAAAEAIAERPATPPAAGSETVVHARGLTKRYKNAVALDGADFEVGNGRIVCLIADVATLPRWIRVHEAIDFVAGVHPRFDRAKCERFLSRTKLQANQKVREMSKGMIVQLHLAIVMAIDARLLVLDEPTLGLDILYRKQFYQSLLEDYFDENKTILITTHQVEEVEHILTDLLFIRDGKVALGTTMEEMGARFAEVLVNADKVEAARALKPIDERAAVFGKSIFVYDSADPEQLAQLGEVKRPSVSDLFVAIMKGT